MPFVKTLSLQSSSTCGEPTAYLVLVLERHNAATASPSIIPPVAVFHLHATSNVSDRMNSVDGITCHLNINRAIYLQQQTPRTS
ncbi:unnamed protein product [Lota lota]